MIHIDAGRRGRAITYFTQDDKMKLRSIANILRNSGCRVPDYMLTIKKQSKRVRRKLEKTVPKRADIAVQNPKKMMKKKKNYSAEKHKPKAVNGENATDSSEMVGKFVRAPNSQKTNKINGKPKSLKKKKKVKTEEQK